MEALKIEYVDIDTIKPYKNNAKTHPREHKEKINRALNNEEGYNKETISHWRAEIRTIQENIDKILRRYKK